MAATTHMARGKNRIERCAMGGGETLSKCRRNLNEVYPTPHVQIGENNGDSSSPAWTEEGRGGGLLTR